MMTLKRGFKAEANRISLRIREKMHLGPIDPLDPLQVCEYLDIKVIKLSELRDREGLLCGQELLKEQRDSFSAVIVRRGLQRAIVHNDAHSLVRQRSNITHELAHCFLNHPLVPLLGSDGQRNRSSVVEEEAAFLGGSLLITNEAAHHIMETGIIIAARSLYGVSAEMLNYRLRVSGAQKVAQYRARRGAAA